MGSAILLFVGTIASIFPFGVDTCQVFSVSFISGRCRYAGKTQSGKVCFRGGCLPVAVGAVPALLVFYLNPLLFRLSPPRGREGFFISSCASRTRRQRMCGKRLSFCRFAVPPCHFSPSVLFFLFYTFLFVYCIAIIVQYVLYSHSYNGFCVFSKERIDFAFNSGYNILDVLRHVSLSRAVT